MQRLSFTFFILASSLCATLSANYFTDLFSANLPAEKPSKKEAKKDSKEAPNEAPKDDSCGEAPHPSRITARHIEAKGIGYNQGYTTLEGYFTSFKPLKDRWIPFADLRGHVFNDGKFAANLGAGIRLIGSRRVWGVYGYYDYRDTHHHSYNQASLGLESLGEIWDFRINGYLPVGDTSASYNHHEFYDAQSSRLIVSQKREFAMKGANVEVGMHINYFKKTPIYLAAGPYYLEGKGKATFGGEFRAAVDAWKYIRLEGNTSYDDVFHWIGQGQISVIFLFEKRRKVYKGKSKSCKMALVLAERALQKVDRNEIIPIDSKQ